MCIKCRLVQLAVNLDDLEPELRRIAKLLYDGKLEPGQIDAAMVKRIADQLMNGVIKGYGALTDLTPAQRSFIAQLQENVYVFSGFKNYQQLKETSLLLLDNEGSYKSFNQFFEDVKQINATYNEVYLEAEYNNAIASAQNAQAWQDFVENGVDMLQFQTAEDDRVREDHAILNGIIVPIGDPLLDTYFTPLDWGCRCEWIPAPGEKPTGYSNQELPDLKPMFSTNIGKTGVIFPDTHPYFNAPKQIADKITDQVSAIEKEDVVNNDITLKQAEREVKSWSIFKQTIEGIVDKSIFHNHAELSLLQKKVIYGYTSRMYIPINKFLNGFSTISRIEATQELSYRKLLNSALDKIDSKFKGTVYRGLDLTEVEVSDFMNLKEWRNKGFVSTSQDAGSAFSGNTKMIIESKTGRDISKLSKYGDAESEVLFRTETKFKINSMVKENDVWYIRMEEMD